GGGTGGGGRGGVGGGGRVWGGQAGKGWRARRSVPRCGMVHSVERFRGEQPLAGKEVAGDRRSAAGRPGPRRAARGRAGHGRAARCPRPGGRPLVRADRAAGCRRRRAGGDDRHLAGAAWAARPGGAVWLGPGDRGPRGGPGRPRAARRTRRPASAGRPDAGRRHPGRALPAGPRASGGADAARPRRPRRAHRRRAAWCPGRHGEIAAGPGPGQLSEGVAGMTWPVADLDAIRRLRVLAAAAPGAFVAETVIDAPFEQVWAVAADLEHELPAYLPDVRAFTITRRDRARLQTPRAAH